MVLKKESIKGEKMQSVKFRQSEWYKYVKYKSFFFMFLPTLIFFIIFKYIPVFGNVIAFKNFSIKEGIWGGEWVGLAHFYELFTAPSFYEVFRNTLTISFSKLLVNFPTPIVFAILLNEIGNKYFKKTVQTLSYLPHFISWVVLASIFKQFLSPSTGPINILIKQFGGTPIYFLGDPKIFPYVLVFTSLWQSLGWSSIVYLAAISGIDPGLYEAATMDGANRFHKMVHITVPSIAPVMVIMFILAVGKITTDDFDQIYNFLSPAVYSTGDVIGTYVYRKGIVDMSYEFSTAVGLFQNVIAFALVVVTNLFAKRVGDYGIW